MQFVDSINPFDSASGLDPAILLLMRDSYPQAEAAFHSIPPPSHSGVERMQLPNPCFLSTY